MSVKGAERKCPLCGQDNNCQHGQGGCWCDTAKFPEGIFELVPKELRGKACICKSCLDKYQNSNK